MTCVRSHCIDPPAPGLQGHRALQLTLLVSWYHLPRPQARHSSSSRTACTSSRTLTPFTCGARPGHRSLSEIAVTRGSSWRPRRSTPRGFCARGTTLPSVGACRSEAVQLLEPNTLTIHVLSPEPNVTNVTTCRIFVARYLSNDRDI